MKDFLAYMLTNIVGKDNFIIKEQENGNDRTIYIIEVPDDLKALLIGKGGKTISAIRSLLRIRANREGKFVDINIVQDRIDQDPNNQADSSNEDKLEPIKEPLDDN